MQLTVPEQKRVGGNQELPLDARLLDARNICAEGPRHFSWDFVDSEITELQKKRVERECVCELRRQKAKTVARY